MKYGKHIYLGQKLKISIPSDRVDTFKRLRSEFHLSIQEDFYENFQVNSIVNYSVKKGDTLNQILNNNGLPYWLIRKYQELKVKKGLLIGQVIYLPEVVELSEETTLVPKN